MLERLQRFEFEVANVDDFIDYEDLLIATTSDMMSDSEIIDLVQNKNAQEDDQTIGNQEEQITKIK